MLADRHQLEVSVAHFKTVVDKLVRELAIGEPTIGVVSRPAPTSQMDFVERQRAVECVVLRPIGDPRCVVPVVAVEIGHLRRRAGRQLGGETVGIGLFEHLVAVADRVFVDRSLAQAGHEQFPRAGGDVFTHGVPAGVPGVEIADHADAVRIGCPDGEIDPLDPIDRAELGPQLAVAVPVSPFGQQVEIEFGKQRRKRIGIVQHRLRSALGRHAQLIATARLFLQHRANGLIKSGGMNAPHRLRHAFCGINDPGLVRVRQERTHRQGTTAIDHDFVGSQHVEGVFVPPLEQRPDLLQFNRRTNTHGSNLHA